MADYNRHMGYVDKGDRMTNSYSINRLTWKGTNKLFFHLSDLAILNSYILFSSRGGKKISHRDFQLKLVRNLLAQAGQERNVPRPRGGPPPASIQGVRLEERGRKTLAYSVLHAKTISCMSGQVCHQKSFSEVPKV